MKILFATDLHGNLLKYNHLVRVAQSFNVDVVINGGDMLPNEGNLFRQGDFISGDLKEHFAQFNKTGIHYLCYLGNDDLRLFDERFNITCREFSHVINLAQRKYEIHGFNFIGMNYVVDYPFRLKDRCRKDTADYQLPRQLGPGVLSAVDGWRQIDDWPSYVANLPSIEDELKRLQKPRQMKKCIYVIHMPPYRLGLDVCRTGEKVGSKAIYDFLSENQPLLSLHGHIHESPEMTGTWQANIGDTICIQPGQKDGTLTYVVGDLKTMTFERRQDSVG